MALCHARMKNRELGYNLRVKAISKSSGARFLPCFFFSLVFFFFFFFCEKDENGTGGKVSVDFVRFVAMNF